MVARAGMMMISVAARRMCAGEAFAAAAVATTTKTLHGARAFSAKSEDIVGSLFAEGFGKMQKFKDSVKDIPVPLMADDKAIAKYAEKLDAARAKAGLPSTFELVAQKLAKLSSETAADDVSQSEFFMKADAYREELGLPKKTFEEVGAVLKDMKTKLDAAKTSADAKKVAKEFRDKLAAMEKKITVSADEEKAYNIETMKTFVTKKSGDLMMELEALQKNNNLSTPVSSLDMTKVLAGK